ncbi:cohesin subunit SA-3 isoform X2 [Patagioenas fasciata]|uniref:cohesin subunit SA-3 isoform X2 n=1 Tax=Patagioenas fasciata TaxID=372321 RepID=UPI003A9950B1
MSPRRSSRAQGGSSGSTSTRGGMSSPPASPTPPDSPDGGSDSSGSDFEETLRPQGKRGPPRGPPRGNVPKRPRRSDRASPSPTPPDPNHLFAAITSAKIAVETLVDEWLDAYKRDRESAFLELLNFIVRSCGCRGVVTPEMFRTLQNSQIIQRLTEDFAEESPEYPVSRGGRRWRRFRAGFCELLGAAVLRGRLSVVYDEFLLPALVSLLTGLADSPVRAFRHTGTLAALKVMTALVTVALGLNERRDNNQRQLEAERAKGPGRRGTERMEGLLDKQRELQEQQQEIESMMNAVFKGVFVHRYRDIVPEIRALCMEELGTWMRSYTALFLTDGHLKYIGWTLHDKQRDVRLQCVKALQALYGRRDTAAHMELFTSRFKTRLVCMVLDKEPEVAVEVVKLLTVMLDTMEDALSEDDCHSVYPVVFVSSRALAAAAGCFLYRRLLDPQRDPDRVPSRDGDNRTFFQRLLSFFMESELHEHAAYLVDSLWDCAGPRLRDWDTMGAMLLEEGLRDRQEKALVEILAASAAQATRGHPPVGRGPPRKFSADAEKAAPLLDVLRCFDLGVYCTGRMEKHLELVLAQLREVMEKHTAPVVLEAASRALHALCAPELALRARGDLLRSRMADQLADKCHRDVTDLLQAAALDEDELYSAAATLKRISVLFNAHDLTPWQLFDPCSRLLQREVDTGEVPPQVLIPAITCVHFHVLWELSHLPSADIPQEQLRGLKNRVTTVASLCQNCLTDPDPGVREQAFVVLSDLLLVFGPQLAQDGRAALAPLLLPPNAGLQSQLAAFLMDHVFQHEPSPTEDGESRIEELHQRRVLLAGFCKLIIYNVLELSAASDVFKHYGKFYGDYGDIIKETLNLTRQMDRQEWARTLLLSLKQLMTELLLQTGPEIRGDESFLEIRDLARRFSLLFSLHQLRNRQALLGLHREGIQFALQEPGEPGQPPLNLPFLEVLSEFSPRLLRPDRALLLAYLELLCQERGWPPPRAAPWPPLLTYGRSLQPQDEGGSLSSAPPSRGPSTSSAKRPRMDAPPRRSSSSPWPSSRPPSPAFTSTALRGGPRPPRRDLSSDRGLLPSSSLSRHSGMTRLSLMVEEEEEEEEAPMDEGSSEDTPERNRPHLPPQNRLRDLFDSTILGIEDS